MTTGIDYVEQFNEKLAEITQPLVQQYEDLDGAIKEREVEIVSMRKARTQLRQMLRSINPELVPTVNKNGGKKKHSGSESYGPNSTVVPKVAEWLQAHAEEINAAGGVHSSGLAVREDFTLIGHQSGISKALATLHTQGIVRLDHTGTGGAKFFKVVV